MDRLDLVLLDVMLPGINGFQVLRQIRAKSDIPILMLSARGEEQDRIDGLELGADDYIVKPFALRELLARVRAGVRRRAVPAAQPPTTLGRGPIRIELDRRRVLVGDRELAIFYERNSWQMAREVTRSLFKTAERLGVTAFVPRIRHEIRDDHLPLNEIAKIPTTDLIDFDYPRPGFGVQSHWHTTRDVPEQCSGQSLVTVVYVVHSWLKSQ